MIRATEEMMRAAMNAGGMPDESNAWAAVDAVLEIIERDYFVGQLNVGRHAEEKPA